MLKIRAMAITADGVVPMVHIVDGRPDETLCLKVRRPSEEWGKVYAGDNKVDCPLCLRITQKQIIAKSAYEVWYWDMYGCAPIRKTWEKITADEREAWVDVVTRVQNMTGDLNG